MERVLNMQWGKQFLGPILGLGLIKVGKVFSIVQIFDFVYNSKSECGCSHSLWTILMLELCFKIKVENMNNIINLITLITIMAPSQPLFWYANACHCQLMTFSFKVALNLMMWSHLSYR
jgi:hypothetical protein